MAFADWVLAAAAAGGKVEVEKCSCVVSGAIAVGGGGDRGRAVGRHPHLEM